MIVRLTPAELLKAYQTAAMRVVQNFVRKAQPQYGQDDGFGGELLHIHGARAECAVGKGLNLYWSGSVGDYDAIDVGDRVEVRAVTSPTRRLILHKDRGDEKKDHLPYVLAELHPTQFDTVTLVGWCYGHEGKQEKYWADPVGDAGGRKRPAYFVPREALRPMEELVEILSKKQAA